MKLVIEKMVFFKYRKKTFTSYNNFEKEKAHQKVQVRVKYQKYPSPHNFCDSNCPN